MSLDKIRGNVSSSIAEVGGVEAMGLHVTCKPTETDGRGHFRVGAQTGAIAAGARTDAEVLQFRWTSSTSLAVIKKVDINGFIATTAFDAGAVNIKLTKATAFSVVGSGTGSSTVLLTGNNGKLRTSFATSAGPSIVVAGTAVLSAGTKTLETTDTALITSHTSAGTAAATPIIGNQYLPSYSLLKTDLANGEYPLVLGNNEGFAIRVTCPATGVWSLGFTIQWAEVAAF